MRGKSGREDDRGPVYDLFGPNFKADPHATFRELRAADPVYAQQGPDGKTIWYVTRYADVVAILLDDEHFCKDPGNARSGDNGGPAPRRSSIHKSINENMLFSDPPTHTRLRSLINEAFTPRRIADMRPRIEQVATQLSHSIQGHDQVDLIAAYALPLPVHVICDLLGIPDEKRQQVTAWSQSIISPGSRNLNYTRRKQNVRAFIQYVQSLLRQRQAGPKDDLITALVQAEVNGQTLSQTELSSMVALLLVTGHETTVNLIGNGVLALLTHDDQLQELFDDPALWPQAIEELLRFDGPVETSTSRWVRRDITIGGRRLRRGEMVRVVLTSANLDERHFSNADCLAVGRSENKHLAFGQGIHYCLGAPLARLEGEIALRTLFDSFPGLRLAEPRELLQWRPGVLFRGLTRLPVSWK